MNIPVLRCMQRIAYLVVSCCIHNRMETLVYTLGTRTYHCCNDEISHFFHGSLSSLVQQQ